MRKYLNKIISVNKNYGVLFTFSVLLLSHSNSLITDISINLRDDKQALLTLQNRVTFVRQSSKHSMMYYLILLAWHTKYTIWIFAVTCCVALFTNEKERLQAWTEHEGNRILNSVRFLGLPDKIVFIGHTLISLRSSIN